MALFDFLKREKDEKTKKEATEALKKIREKKKKKKESLGKKVGKGATSAIEERKRRFAEEVGDV